MCLLSGGRGPLKGQLCALMPMLRTVLSAPGTQAARPTLPRHQDQGSDHIAPPGYVSHCWGQLWCPLVPISDPAQCSLSPKDHTVSRVPQPW